jgi:hypothetical protein
MSDTPKRDRPGEEPDELGSEEERALAEALIASVRPTPLSSARHEEILARALGATPEEDAATPEELADASAFAQAIDGRGDHADLALARALRFATRPEALAAEALEGALARSLGQRKRAPNVYFVSFGAASAVLALAAGVLLFLRFEPAEPEPRPELLLSRSLAPLLGPEAADLSASARLDRIASARSRDLRANRYAAWGVR